jgi:multiple sugar transport system substrate-binding protein
MDFTPMVVYYNKDLFDASGEPYPAPGWTRREFLAKARRLARDGRYGFKFANWMPGWIMWLWNAGGDVVGEVGQSPSNASGYGAAGVFDSQENIETVQFLADMVMRHKVAPALSATAAQGIDPFANGQAAMEISGHWALVGYKSQKALKLDRIGVAELPSESGPSKTVMYESGLAIGRHCKHPDVAWKFIRYMTSRESQRAYHQTGIAISARKDVSQERATDEREREFLRIVPSARPPWGSKIVKYNLVEDVGQKALDAVLKSGVPVKLALEKAAVEVDRELSKP